MRYSEGHVGRVIIGRFDDGEEFVSGMKNLVQTAQLSTALIFFLGALRSGQIVAGPQKDAIPPTPLWVSFDGAWEVVGVGTLFASDGEMALHLHGALGRGERTLVGCLRKIAEVYLVMEVILIEILDSDAGKIFDPDSGLFLLEPLLKKKS